MHTRIVSLLVLGALACVPLGCAYTGSMAETLHVDSSTTVEGSVGEEMTFDLPGNAGTGYTWKLVGSLPSYLEAIGGPVFVPDHANMPGSSGVTRFQYKATSAGGGTLRFEYARSWEKDVPAVRWAEVKMSVKG